MSSSLLSVSVDYSGFVSMRTYVHLISFVWTWPCEKLFKICFLLRANDLRFEGIGFGSDFQECAELCLVFSFRLFFEYVCASCVSEEGGKADKKEQRLSFEIQEIAFFLRINVSPCDRNALVVLWLWFRRSNLSPMPILLGFYSVAQFVVGTMSKLKKPHCPVVNKESDKKHLNQAPLHSKGNTQPPTHM